MCKVRFLVIPQDFISFEILWHTEFEYKAEFIAYVFGEKPKDITRRSDYADIYERKVSPMDDKLLIDAVKNIAVPFVINNVESEPDRTRYELEIDQYDSTIMMNWSDPWPPQFNELKRIVAILMKYIPGGYGKYIDI